MASKKPFVVHRFGFYSVRNPDGTIAFNATNLSDANGAFKKFFKKSLKKSDIRYG